MDRIGIFILVAFMLAAFTFGCSSGGENPVFPTGENHAVVESSGTTACFGLWQITIDPATGTGDIVQLRNADKIINVLAFMEPPPLTSMDLDWADMYIDFPNNHIDVGVILKHPIPDDVFTGFDVRGVCFGPVVENADGLTIIPGPEFFSGVPFGYQDGLLGAPDSYGDYEGLAGYKYFCVGLGEDEVLSDFFSDPGNLADRGKFGAGANVQRNYSLDWDDTGYAILIFNYAIYANYDWPTGDTPWDVDDWDISTANSAEAFCGKITEVANSLYFSGTGGGAISLDVEVWDWLGDVSGVTIEAGDGAIIPETSYDTDSTGSTAYSHVYSFTDVAAVPTTNADLDVIITVTDAKTFGECWFLNLLPEANSKYDDQVYNCFVHSAEVAPGILTFDFTPEMYYDGIGPDGSTDYPVPTDWDINFDASGSAGASTFEWDLEGDGTYESGVLTVSDYTGSYPAGTTPDTYNATLRINGGATTSMPIVVATGVYVNAFSGGSSGPGDKANPYDTINNGVAGATTPATSFVMIRGDIGSGVQQVYNERVNLTSAHTGLTLQGYSNDPVNSEPPAWRAYTPPYRDISGYYWTECIWANGTDNLTIDGLEFEDIRGVETPGGYWDRRVMVIHLEDCDNARVSHIYMHYMRELGYPYYSWKPGYAIRPENSANLVLSNILFHNFDVQSDWATAECIVTTATNNILIVNCTADDIGDSTSYHHQARGFRTYDSTSPQMLNNILTTIRGYPGYCQAIRGSGNTSPLFDYGNVWNISYNVRFMEDWTEGTNCINVGTGSDPLYVSSSDHHLQGTSPCIDTGDPDTGYNDPDGSRNDIGCYGGPGGDWNFEN